MRIENGANVKNQLFSKDMRGLESKDKNDGKALAKIFCLKQDGKS